MSCHRQCAPCARPPAGSGQPRRPRAKAPEVGQLGRAIVAQVPPPMHCQMEACPVRPRPRRSGLMFLFPSPARASGSLASPAARGTCSLDLLYLVPLAAPALPFRFSVHVPPFLPLSLSLPPLLPSSTPPPRLFLATTTSSSCRQILSNISVGDPVSIGFCFQQTSRRQTDKTPSTALSPVSFPSKLRPSSGAAWPRHRHPPTRLPPFEALHAFCLDRLSVSCR